MNFSVVLFLFLYLGFCFGFCSFSNFLFLGAMRVYCLARSLPLKDYIYIFFSNHYALIFEFLLSFLGFILQECNWVLLQKSSMCRLILEVMSCGSAAVLAAVALNPADSR